MRKAIFIFATSIMAASATCIAQSPAAIAQQVATPASTPAAPALTLSQAEVQLADKDLQIAQLQAMLMEVQYELSLYERIDRADLRRRNSAEIIEKAKAASDAAKAKVGDSHKQQ
jgi:hypothetical protein